MITADDLVRREVCHCASSLISTLAGGYGARIDTGHAESRRNLEDACEQAFELAAPIDDWEETLIQNGWEKTAGGWKHMEDLGDEPISTEDAVTEAMLDEPCQREVYEHWIVTDWLADKLIEHGEKVDKDFAGMCIWARTTTGQAIAADHVIEAITAEVNAA